MILSSKGSMETTIRSTEDPSPQSSRHIYGRLYIHAPMERGKLSHNKDLTEAGDNRVHDKENRNKE